MILGTLLLAILITYDPLEGSLNSVNIYESKSKIDQIRNFIADLLIQIFGISIYIVPFLMILWSCLLYNGQKIKFIIFKLLSLVLIMFITPALIHNNFKDNQGFWQDSGHLLGEISKGGILGLFSSLQIPYIDRLYYVYMGFVFLNLFFLASITWRQYKIIIATLLMLFIEVLEIGKYLVIKGINKLKNQSHHKPNVLANKNIKIVPDIDYINSGKLFEDKQRGLWGNFFKHPTFFKNPSESSTDLPLNNSLSLRLNESKEGKNLENESAAGGFPLWYQTANNASNNEQESNTLSSTISSILNRANPIAKTAVDNHVKSNTLKLATAETPSLSTSSSVTSTINNKDSLSSTSLDPVYIVPLDFLAANNQKPNQASNPEIKQQALKLEQIVEEFGINGKIIGIKTGPVVILYEMTIPAGIKTSKLISLETDIALRMKAISVRIAVVAGKDVIGIEIPNSNRKTVYLKEILQSNNFQNSTMKIPLVLGCDINGAPIVTDLTTMPHLLIAGTTGSGKSVGINAMILSILYKLSPKQCKLIMIDPKMLELSVYQDIPHLITPVVTNPKQAISALKWVVKEMELRYYQMSVLGVRNIIGYNEKILDTQGIEDKKRELLHDQGVNIQFDPMPYIVVVIDEMADLMIVAGKEVEMAVQRLAQMARASGIHLIMATQRPSVDVITGTIKANFPTRISFQVSSKIDSRTILGEQGGEQLLGKGDMLYMSGVGRMQRVHGPFIADEEVGNIVKYLKTLDTPNYVNNLTENPKLNTEFENQEDEKDEFYNQSLEIIKKEGRVSTSFLQRRFQIGYNRAARIIEQLEEEGVISKPNHNGRRDIFIK